MGTLKRSLRKCVVPPRVFLLRGTATTLFLNPDRLRRGELVPSKHAYMHMTATRQRRRDACPLSLGRSVACGEQLSDEFYREHVLAFVAQRAA